MTDPNIYIASTPTKELYCSREFYNSAIEQVFARTWQYLGHHDNFPDSDYIYPVWLLKGCLDEPLLLSKDSDGSSILISNVCTHRGFVLADEPLKSQTIRCRYHGRCFSQSGEFVSMPEFDDALNFPTRMDHLAKAHLFIWNHLYFGGIDPSMNAAEVFAPIDERLHWFPFDKLQFSSNHSKDYLIQANWALYNDNYLEGFHIPYVHQSLNKVIDYSNYETHLFRYCNLQIAVAKEGEPVFDLPRTSPDHGKQIAAYYFWIFPNMMLNFYPWGISLNVVEPQGFDQTKISFHTFISDPDVFNTGAGSQLNRVELEDEEVVESVQRGLRSRLYHSGRYSPKMEQGVHHFHLLLQEFMNRKHP